MKKTTSWFTLIELIVSITILSVIMVSVFMIFFIASDLNMKADISRAMQENVKNIVETIAEDVRKNSLTWVNDDILTTCKLPTDGTKFLGWEKLCIGNISYYIATQEGENWVRVNTPWVCEEKPCYILKDVGGFQTPLSNSWVQIKNMNFFVTNNGMKKVIFTLNIEPSKYKWVRSSLIEQNKIALQTTLSERIYHDY